MTVLWFGVAATTQDASAYEVVSRPPSSLGELEPGRLVRVFLERDEVFTDVDWFGSEDRFLWTVTAQTVEEPSWFGHVDAFGVSLPKEIWQQLAPDRVTGTASLPDMPVGSRVNTSMVFAWVGFDHLDGVCLPPEWDEFTPEQQVSVWAQLGGHDFGGAVFDLRKIVTRVLQLDVAVTPR